MVEADNGGWYIITQASENNQKFVLILNTPSLRTVPDIAIGEAMANSITLSCALPASPQ
jgi:hypothetical protein